MGTRPSTFRRLPARPRRLLALGALLAFSVPTAGNLATASAANPELAVTVSQGPSAVVQSGSKVTYRVTVTNTGSGDASGVVVTDVVLDKPGAALPLASPLNMTPLSGADIDAGTVVASSGTCSAVPFYSTTSPLQERTYGERLVCTGVSVAAGSSVTIDVPVWMALNTFGAPQPAGAVVNLATVDLCDAPVPDVCRPTGDTSPVDDSAVVETAVIIPT